MIGEVYGNPVGDALVANQLQEHLLQDFEASLIHNINITKDQNFPFVLVKGRNIAFINIVEAPKGSYNSFINGEEIVIHKDGLSWYEADFSKSLTDFLKRYPWLANGKVKVFTILSGSGGVELYDTIDEVRTNKDYLDTLKNFLNKSKSPTTKVAKTLGTMSTGEKPEGRFEYYQPISLVHWVLLFLISILSISQFFFVLVMPIGYMWYLYFRIGLHGEQIQSLTKVILVTVAGFTVGAALYPVLI